MYNQYRFNEDKNVEPAEFIELMTRLGWGSQDDYDHATVRHSLTQSPYVCHVRDERGRLVGYVNALSDGAFTTFVGALVVHPEAQRQGIGSELLHRVEQRFAGVPMYVATFDDCRQFFLKNDYKQPKRAMSVVSKRNPLHSEMAA